MIEITSTELARKLKKILDRVEHKGEEVIITRNNHRIARLLPGAGKMTALEAMSDLYATLSPGAAKGWLDESRAFSSQPQNLDQLKNPWGT